MKKHGEKFEGRALGSKGFPTGTCTRIMLKGCPKARYDAPVMDDCGEDGHHLMQSISSVSSATGAGIASRAFAPWKI